MDVRRAAEVFDELRRTCEQRDNGRLWGFEVYGSALLVDPRSRAIFANQADAEGQLEAAGNGVYTGLRIGGRSASDVVRIGIAWREREDSFVSRLRLCQRAALRLSARRGPAGLASCFGFRRA